MDILWKCKYYFRKVQKNMDAKINRKKNIKRNVKKKM